MCHPSVLGPWAKRLFLVALLLLTLTALWNTAVDKAPAGESLTVPPPSATEGDAPHAAPAETGEATAAGHGGEAAILIASLYILVLAGFVGFEVIGGVSPLLHTPLMSATNAISAISVVGALVIAGEKEYGDWLSRVLGFVAVTAAMINVVGGFMITDRMLRMFKLKEARR